MKKAQLFMLAVAGCFALTSCEKDDVSNDLNSDLKGTYELTSLIVPTEEDYDSDGDSNINLVMEGTCYNDSWISFHEDGTYDEESNSSTTTVGGLSLSCTSAESSGTYIQDGNMITTTRTSGSGTATATYNFDANSHTLSRTITGGIYSGWNSTTSLWTNMTANMQVTHTKYTNDDNDSGNNDNDDDNTDAASRAELVGNFDMTSMIVATAQDLDQDGDSSSNLTTESTCYSASNITFNEDGTYEEGISKNVISSSGFSLSCNAEIILGTWSRNGDSVTTRHLSGTTTLSSHYMFDATSHLLTSSNANGQYPTYNSTTTLYTMATGNIDYTYTKD